MTSINDFHPLIQTTISFFSTSRPSFQKIAIQKGISRQAVRKQVQKGTEYLLQYGVKNADSEKVQSLQKKIKTLEGLVSHLRRELVVKSVTIYLQKALLEKVKQFIPELKLTRLKWFQKKYLLDMAQKYQNSGGLLKEYCKAIKKAPQTLIEWKKAYEKHGKNGLVDKRCRPKNFGNKLPSHVKAILLNLFLKFPKWTEYQYHGYIRNNPTTKWYVSIPTIKKIKKLYQEKSEFEKKRILKRWAFDKGTDVWTVDFTVILKTENYKLQLLTVSDARSRFFFSSVLFLETSTKEVMDHLQDLFLRYGKPTIIKADNGPEFRTEFKNQLQDLSTYLINNPYYYGQFNGAHERVHKTLKRFISVFYGHKNLSRLLNEINEFTNQYNHDIPQEYLDNRTPFEVFTSETDFVPENVEIVTPYEKDGELRMKFQNRGNKQARIAVELIKKE
jgi:predicted DNA-binding protein YlxM (UPF0122 family)/transposase InsO family protein